MVDHSIQLVINNFHRFGSRCFRFTTALISIAELNETLFTYAHIRVVSGARYVQSTPVRLVLIAVLTRW